MKIICIGRNYLEHARELNSPLPAEPVFFIKPETSLVIGDHEFILPDFSNEIHHEVEVVYLVGKDGKNIPESQALDYLEAVGIGFDFTARDLQQRCKEKGLPWEIGKAFDHSAPIAAHFFPVKSMSDLTEISFHLDINGSRKQEGFTGDMIFSIEKIVAYVSRFMTLQRGDLIFTGTPEGVGPVKHGDIMEGFLEGNKMLTCRIRQA